MRCHSCGTEVREGQKFCMECGASFRGVADVTGEVPIVRPGSSPPPSYAPPQPTGGEDHTVPLALQPVGADDRTAPVAVTTRRPSVPDTTVRTTAEHLGGARRAGHADTPAAASSTPPPSPPGEHRSAGAGHDRRRPHRGPVSGQQAAVTPGPRFRLRFLLLVGLLAAAATAAAVLTTVVTITPPPDGTVPEYAVNDFGTNNTIGGIIAAAAMIVGALVWCTGHRWGAGLAGGAGAALAGWAALVIGAAEWRLDLAAAGCRRDPLHRVLGARRRPASSAASP